MNAIRPLALIIFVVSMIAGCAAMRSDINPSSGFRDIAWGTPFESIPDLNIIPRGSARWKWAVHESGNQHIGKVCVKKIEYIFVDDAFAGVNVDFSGYENLGFLIKALEKDYGPPRIRNDKMKMLAWKLEGTTVMLRYYDKQHLGNLKFTRDQSTKN